MKTAEIEEKTNYLLAENLYSQMNPQKFVDWAVYLLENDFESENILILAGLDKYPGEEIKEYFWKCIDDLKLNLNKSNFELIENYAVHIANMVVNNKMKPEEGLRIMNIIVRESEYSGKYIQFHNLAEDIEFLNNEGRTLFNSFEKTDNLDEIITEEFRLFLRAEKLNLNDDYREFSYCLNCNTLKKPRLKSKINWFGKVKYNFWVCSCCGSKELAHFTNQKGKNLILDELEKENTI